MIQSSQKKLGKLSRKKKPILINFCSPRRTKPINLLSLPVADERHRQRQRILRQAARIARTVQEKAITEKIASFSERIATEFYKLPSSLVKAALFVVVVAQEKRVFGHCGEWQFLEFGALV